MHQQPHSPSPADSLLALHQRLKEHYNSPHWWPADGPFEVIVGAILTQNTNWRNVEKALGNLKAAGALDAAALRAMPEPALAELIRPSGFFTVKARRLKALLAWLGEDWRERLAGDLNEVRAGLLSVNGVGEETADAILLYAAGHPTFVIDAFTRRILDRVGITPSARSNEGYRRMFMDNLPHEASLFNAFHAQFVQLGKEYCRPQPRCAACPLRDLCATGSLLPSQEN